MKLHLICIIVILNICFAFIGRSARAQTAYTGIIGALDYEVQTLKQQMQETHDTVIQRIVFSYGSIGGKKVVITESGVGKVNAAIITTLLIEHFRPARVLFSGIAGGLNPGMHPGDVVVAEKIGYHDYGRKWSDSFETWATRNPVTGDFNPRFFKADSLLLLYVKKIAGTIQLHPIDRYVPSINTGIILTGDLFLSDGKMGAVLRKQTGADAVEMEGAAVAQVAFQQGIPFLIIRSLSDSANDEAALDFHLYGKTAAENSAMIILELLKKL